MMNKVVHKNGGIHMQSFAVSANGRKSFLFDPKVYLSHFSNAKYVKTRFVKIKEYTHKKKNNPLENHAYFPFRHHSREHNIMGHFS